MLEDLGSLVFNGVDLVLKHFQEAFYCFFSLLPAYFEQVVFLLLADYLVGLLSVELLLFQFGLAEGLPWGFLG